jgi:hypothetical protein
MRAAVRSSHGRMGGSLRAGTSWTEVWRAYERTLVYGISLGWAVICGGGGTLEESRSKYGVPNIPFVRGTSEGLVFSQLHFTHHSHRYCSSSCFSVSHSRPRLLSSLRSRSHCGRATTRLRYQSLHPSSPCHPSCLLSHSLLPAWLRRATTDQAASR